MGTPFGCEAGLDVTVEVDEFDAVDETDDDELVRWRGFRCISMLTPRASSDDGFIELSVCAPLIHPGLFRFAKLGGVATAVMGKAQLKMGEALDGRDDENRCPRG
jgi:hypothetical protein